jgi:S1-C subfamily serine protease
MQTLKAMLLAVVVSASTLVFAAGCDAVRSGVSTAAPTATVAQNPTPTAAPAPPQASTTPPQPTAAAKAPGAQPQSGPQSGTSSATPAPAAPVLQAAPAQQPTDAVVRVYRDVRPSVVTVISSVVQPGFRSEPQPQGTGSGFMIDDRGHILTNNHVIQDADRLEVALSNGTTIPADLVGRDPRFDLAVIRAQIPPDQLRVVKLADSDKIETGEQAIAIGNPYGLEGTVTTGVVSSRRPVVNEPEGDGVLVNAIQTDTSINPGNSGGPLLNARGEVIGVNTLGLQPRGAPAGLNFAIPINNAKKVLPDLIANGSYPHPFVGISSTDITQAMANALNLPVQSGLLIQSVEPNTGAARAGLRGGSETQAVRSRQVAVGGDIIVAIDGNKILRPEDFIAYLETNKKAGDTVTLTVIRDGQQRDVQVTLGERPRR